MLNRRGKSITDIMISIVVIILLTVTLYGFCAGSMYSEAEASGSGLVEGTLTVTPDSVPHPASDQGVPSSISRFGSTTTSNAYIPTRGSQKMSYIGHLPEAETARFALTTERGFFVTDAPEFTPFLYIKTTHKRE